MKNFIPTVVIALTSFQIVAQEWSEIADMPIGKHHPVSFSIDGFGYAATGWDLATGPSDDVFKYDPTSDSWEAISNFPGTDRSFAIGQAYNGKGYLGFGASTTNYLGDIYEFNPTTENWSLVTICPCAPRRHPAFLIVDDQIFVGLGDGAAGDLNDWWVYDMQLDEWTQLPSLPAAQRHHPFHFIVNQELFVGFGHGGPIVYNDWYKFDRLNSSWEVKSDFNGEARVAGTQFNHGDFGYVLSGDGSNHSYMEEGEFWQYNPSDDSWEQMPSHPGISLWAPGSFVIGDTVYFFGGENRQTSLIQSDAWKFSFQPKAFPEGLNDAEGQAGFSLFPNPAYDLLNIKADFEIAQINIFGLTGQKVFENVNTTGSVNISSLPSGIYLIRLKDLNGKEYASRWVKN